MVSAYQPKTGARCTCKRGVHRDNCPQCEGTGWVIDFRAIHARREDSRREREPCCPRCGSHETGKRYFVEPRPDGALEACRHPWHDEKPCELRAIVAECWTCGATFGEPGHALEAKLAVRHRAAGHDVRERGKE